jgi:copper chaperone CopZ
MKYKLTVEGMHCASCASNIERSLKKVNGVKEVAISLMLNKCAVECADNVSEEDIKKAIAKAGYKVISIEKK